MAGIPNIMKSMLKSAIPMLKKGAIIQSKTLEVMLGESKIAISFEELQNKYKEVEMGSYPFTRNGNHGTALVLRSANYESLDNAFAELEIVINGLK